MAALASPWATMIPNEPLTIDPQLIYSTFLGGSAFDGAKSVAVDFAGNAYITGVTQSTNFPTQNPFSNSLNGDKDAFVVKINPTGTAACLRDLPGRQQPRG